ncbi:Hypothetical predicted protein [Xyrichtys novacula]|uniref:Uncharacterized protein n=1 Tax=Xyrichtys novacula TaxID=13765 RepID=A0AAV1F1C8_XYRNO|nr:Hypothetical predicted protein [Xyrichtys novacula]
MLLTFVAFSRKPRAPRKQLRSSLHHFNLMTTERHRQNGKISVHCPHGLPGPEPHRPTAHPPERPVQSNFSIGGERRSDTAEWQQGRAVIGRSQRQDGGDVVGIKLLRIPDKRDDKKAFI